MKRSNLVMILAAVAVFAGTWWFASRDQRAASPGEPAPAAAPPNPIRTAAAPVQPRAVAPAPPNVPPGAAPDVTRALIAQWIADTNHPNAATRAAAISGLARAPSADAVPVLRRVLLNGEPDADRPLALQSLRALALAQGDGDGAIRAAVREVLYHGDDRAPTVAAQETLDAIEAAQ